MLSFICILVSSLFTSPSIFEQDQQKADSLQYEVSVTLKLIQVYVSDKDGNPVQDLTKEDFLIYDNGRLITVTDFEIHSLELPPEKETEAPPRMSRKFFLLLDAYRNDGLGLKKARTLALHFIETQVHPEDELGLLTYSIGRGLVLHWPLTTDHEKIREAVKTIKLFPGITVGSYGGSGVTSMDEAVDFTKSLNDFAVSLRYTPGYKHIILFSAGLPRALFASDDPRLRYEHERLAKELASSSSPIYTVDTQGERDLVQGRELKGDHSLRRLAALTGGRHFTNVDYQETISEDIQNSTGNYYVLGYYVEEAWDGKYHEIKVKVKRKGVRVQAQKGYFSPKAYAKFSKLEKRLHLLDLARNPSPQFDLPQDMPSISVPWRDSNSSAVLHLSEIVPADLEEILGNKAELFTLVYDDEGVLTAEGKKEMDFTESPPGRICTYTFFPQPQGRYDYITILRNKKTGAAAKAASTVVFPENQQSQPALSGPVFFVPGRGSLCLPMEIESAEGKSKTKEFNLDAIAPRIQGSISPLVFDLDKNTAAMYAVFGLKKEAKEKKALEFVFVPRLRSKTTDETYPLRHTERNDILTDSENTIVLELELTPVPAGKYVLEISVAGTSLLQDLIFSQDVFIR
ncbi:MAG: VWA domain-containing protein [Candidatus Aminicenantes bacterium]|nr:MAG: VWA domain-containing protein [Candidatus Aminicenantes bacterium]